MKEYFDTTGIVIKKTAVKDNSASVTLLTPDMGIVRFTKHGITSRKSLLSSVLEPPNSVEVKLEKTRNKFSLIDVSVKHIYENMRKDYKKTFMLLNIFKTLQDQNFHDIKDYGLIYRLIKKMLAVLDNSDPCLLTAAAYFYYKLAWCIGIEFSHGQKKYPHFLLDLSSGTFRDSQIMAGQENELAVSEDLFDMTRSFHNIRFADVAQLNYITVRIFNEFRTMYKIYTGYHFDKPILIQTAEIEGE